MAVLLAGCVGNARPEPTDEPYAPPPPMAVIDTGEPVAQTWVVPGERPRGTDAVWAEINAVLQARWNLCPGTWPSWAPYSALGRGPCWGGETAAISEETVRLQNAFVEAGLETVRLEMQRQLDTYLDARLD